MKTKRTKTLSPSVIRDALSVAGGMYAMNAPYATGYAFYKDKTGKVVDRGEFVSDRRLEESPWDWDGFIRFSDKTVKDLKSGEVISLAPYLNTY